MLCAGVLSLAYDRLTEWVLRAAAMFVGRPNEGKKKVEYGDFGEQRYVDGTVHDMRDTQHRLN